MDIVLETNSAQIPRRSHGKLARRILAGMKNVNSSIRKMQVSLKVEKGARKGQDKICQIQLHLANGGQIIIKQKAKRFASAIKDGIRRARKLVIQQAAKKRHASRRMSVPQPA